MFSLMKKFLDADNRSKEFLIKDPKWVELTPRELAAHFVLRNIV